MEIMNVNQFESNKNIGSEMMVSRQAQEVQAAMIVAKRFPRDEFEAFNRIMKACKRKSLAEQAEYVYPKGGQKVTGPSIRLAEAVAQSWGNIDYGVIELEQKNGSSEMMAYAWDLETNTRSTKIFSVKHKRDTKKGSYELTDSRDVYELTANMGARRVRACILAVIPGDVIDAAVEECRNTLKDSHKEPLEDRLRKMIKVFSDDFQVSKEHIEKYIGYKLESFSEQDFVKLRGIYKSLKDGMAGREDYFDIKGAAPVEGKESALEKRLKKGEQEGSKDETKQG